MNLFKRKAACISFVGPYPIFQLHNLYWEEERDRYYISVRCILYSSTKNTDFKLLYVFHNGEWKFLGEGAVTYADFEWYITKRKNCQDNLSDSHASYSVQIRHE